MPVKTIKKLEKSERRQVDPWPSPSSSSAVAVVVLESLFAG